MRMMVKPPKLTQRQRERLGYLEPELETACKSENFYKAKELVLEIQELLRPTGHEVRLLRSKNRLFECAMEAGELEFAISGFLGVRQRARQSTRLYIEATALLAISYIRQRDLAHAQPLMAEVLAAKANIKSEERRKRFIQTTVQRFQEEGLLAGLAGVTDEVLDTRAVQERAGQLLASMSEDELFKGLGELVPEEAVHFFERVQNASRKQLTAKEVQYLPLPKDERKALPLGKTLFSALNRVIWRSLCDPDSEVYKMWFTDGLKAVLNKKVLTASIIVALSGLKLGFFGIAVHVTSIVLKTGLEVVCEVWRPSGIMDLRNI
jgi:hypothetical protein